MWSHRGNSVDDPHGKLLFQVKREGGEHIAAFIVRSCNSHNALMDVAERVAQHFAGTDAPLGEFARQAIAHANAEN
jgi:hypothetical protein